VIAPALTPDLEYFVGKLPPAYQYEGHAQIGRMLDEYGIPFFYRQPTLICAEGSRRIQRPDFTLPTYNNMVLEYVPSEGQARDASRRDAVYRQNGITALFLRPFDLARPGWQERFYDQLEQRYRQPPPQSAR
jgi:hypothetical protein